MAGRGCLVAHSPRGLVPVRRPHQPGEQLSKRAYNNRLQGTFMQRSTHASSPPPPPPPRCTITVIAGVSAIKALHSLPGQTPAARDRLSLLIPYYCPLRAKQAHKHTEPCRRRSKAGVKLARWAERPALPCHKCHAADSPAASTGILPSQKNTHR